ncbi:unnamed protein product [Caenorhabditis bovis]|uniref:VWFA domain-containing protein n=1 Tax=Caenorhabditis bovis TaxID=2654633 RepID=A0A8S1E769_9PELO|nr:unnamed protein product [Caenorhabditis bovis]
MKSLLLLLLIILNSQFGTCCVDVLFVVDTKGNEISRHRAIEIAKQLPDELKIRRWVVVSRHDRYVPRVVRNNDELISVLATVAGDYDRFLDVAGSEIARRTKGYQQFVILLFSETPVNQTMVQMWRSISKAPALHVFRIGTTKKREILSEDEHTNFEKLIACGKSLPTSIFSDSSKFNENEIRRKPSINPFTTTRRPLTSTRDPLVRRLTFFNVSDTLISPPTTRSAMTITRKFPRMKVTRRPSTFRVSSTTTATLAPTTLGISFETSELLNKDILVKSRSVHFAATDRPMTTRSTLRPTTRIVTQTTKKTRKIPLGYSVRVGLIGFSSPGRSLILVPLDKYDDKDDLIEEMFKMRTSGGTTKTGQAIRFGIKAFDDLAHPARKNVKKVLVVLTDGYSQDNTKEASRAARSRGIQMVAVAVKDKLAQPDEQQLADIAGNAKNVLISPTGRLLREKILGSQCRI